MSKSQSDILKMVNEPSMTSKEFEIAIDDLVQAMTTFHNRLLRIEKWMLHQDAAKKKAKLSRLTGVKPK